MSKSRDYAERLLEFWDEYAVAAEVGQSNFYVLSFGDCCELADELAAAVLAGNKRATASLRRDFRRLGLPLPKPGDFGVIVDGNKRPCCIVRIVRVDTKSMRDVDESFVRQEGGGDATVAWWLSAHARFFRRQTLEENFTIDDATEVLLEQFEVVWPPLFADFELKRT